MTKNRDVVRIRREEKLKINSIINEMVKIEKEKISYSEFLKRTFNIPNLSNVLIEDSRIKSKKRKRNKLT